MPGHPSHPVPAVATVEAKLGSGVNDMVMKTVNSSSQRVNADARPATERLTTRSTFKAAERDEHSRSLRQDGYTIVRGIFDRSTMDICASYALMMQANGLIQPWENRHGFNARYADLLMESLLLHLQPAMEQSTGLSLFPTYSFLRIYETGAVLQKHTDRPSCEISASLTIGYDATQPWPLWVESNGQSRACALETGDMLVYRGREVPHWREQFDGRYWIQAFFHYVDANGALAAYKYDGRAGIGRGDAPGVIRTEPPEAKTQARQSDFNN